jgi:hypothetical protein
VSGGYPVLASGTISDLSSAVSLSTRGGSITSSTVPGGLTPVTLTASAAHGLLFGTITAVTPGPPIVITSAGHGLTTGDCVCTSPPIHLVQGIGNTFSAEIVQVVDSDTFSIPTPGHSPDQWAMGATWCRVEPFCIDGHTTNTSINGLPFVAYAVTSTQFALIGSVGVGSGSGGTWRALPMCGGVLELQAVGGAVNMANDGSTPTNGGTASLVATASELVFNSAGNSASWFKYRFIENVHASGAQLAWQICGVIPTP